MLQYGIRGKIGRTFFNSCVFSYTLLTFSSNLIEQFPHEVFAVVPTAKLSWVYQEHWDEEDEDPDIQIVPGPTLDRILRKARKIHFKKMKECIMRRVRQWDLVTESYRAPHEGELLVQLLEAEVEVLQAGKRNLARDMRIYSAYLSRYKHSPYLFDYYFNWRKSIGGFILSDSPSAAADQEYVAEMIRKRRLEEHRAEKKAKAKAAEQARVQQNKQDSSQPEQEAKKEEVKVEEEKKEIKKEVKEEKKKGKKEKVKKETKKEKTKKEKEKGKTKKESKKRSNKL